ncbi:MAG: protein BatD [Anaerolineaceae bacterium]|nr:protein BatD [Anaerolineaceae bacterium]
MKRFIKTRVKFPKILLLSSVIALLLLMMTPVHIQASLSLNPITNTTKQSQNRLSDLSPAQDEINFTAQVDRQTVYLGERITLTLILIGTSKSINSPDIRTIEGFSVTSSGRSSQLSFVNGKKSSQVIFTYILQPTHSGTITIPPISIRVDGNWLETQALEIEVLPAVEADESAAPSDIPSELNEKGLFVEAELSNPSPYLGEQTNYIFRLYQAVQLNGRPELIMPDFVGFLAYDLSPNKQYNLELGNVTYLVTEVRKALFPTQTGNHEIQPSSLIIPGDFFSSGIELQTESVSMDVQPLPGDAPAAFTGAVGQFELQSELSPLDINTGEPLTYKLTINGTGNLDTVPDATETLAENLSDWRIYDSSIDSQIQQSGEQISGKKIIERLLVPQKEGTFEIPPVELVFFNPQSELYQTVKTKAHQVNVLPASENTGAGSLLEGNKVIRLDSDIRHIKPAPSVLHQNKKAIWQMPAYWIAWLIPALLLAAAIVLRNRRLHLSNNLAQMRSLQARKKAFEGIKKARRLSKKSEQKTASQDEIYNIAAQTLHQYLADKLDLHAASLTMLLVRSILEDNSANPDAIERTLNALQWADMGRFAPIASGRNAEELLDDIQNIINDLEEELK